MVDNTYQNIEPEDFQELSDLIDGLPLDSKLYTEHMLNIPRYIKFILKSPGKTQNYICEQLGKTEAQVSTWLSGKQNMTLRTISKLESALSINIINPEIKTLIEGIRSEATIDSPVFSFKNGNTYNVFIVPENKGVCEISATVSSRSVSKDNISKPSLW